MWNRRQFIKAMGVLGGAIMTPFQWLGRVQASPLSDDSLPPGAELYEGFLLLPELPEDVALPEIIRAPRLQAPNECGIGGAKIDAVVELYNNAEELATRVKFPVFVLGQVPDGLRPGNAFLVSNEEGEVYSLSHGYEVYTPETDSWASIVSLTAVPEFYRPFPLWSSKPVEPDGPAIILDKVDFLPSAGIRIVTQLGFVCHWIFHDVFYTLVVEPPPLGQDARSLATSLALA
jgi:hypothetical protein